MCKAIAVNDVKKERGWFSIESTVVTCYIMAGMPSTISRWALVFGMVSTIGGRVTGPTC